MRVALVYPRVKDRDLTQPLGLATVATYVREYGGFNDIKIFDNNFDDIHTVIDYKPDIIGITAMTIDYNRAKELAAYFKQKSDAHILIGGVHISTLPTSLAKCFDLGIVGEGEQTFLEVLQFFEAKGGFEKGIGKIKGLVLRENRKIKITKTRELIEPLDKIPIIDRDFLNIEYFKKKMIPHMGRHGIEGSILTARGCPYRCVFCSTAAFWKRVRFHSAERVYSEIKMLIEKYGADHITIWDDLFTANISRLKELAEFIRKDDVTNGITISCQARANQINDSLCGVLKNLNVKQVGFGFESGSERILNFLKRGTVTLEQNKNAIITCKKHGIRVYGSLIFGSPGEKIEDMKKTIDFIRFAKKHGADAIWIFVMTPFPATDIWDIAKERKKVSDDMNWDKLSHQNIEDAMLLDPDIDKEEFKKTFLLAREELNYFRIKYIKENIRNNLLETLKTAVTNPHDTMETVLGVLSKNRRSFQR